jgi:hypothetical protein
MTASILWRRLDTEGHDCCRSIALGDGRRRLEGTAVFLDAGKACGLAYFVETGPDWLTRSAGVVGMAGGDRVDIAIERRGDGVWLLNGVERPAATGLIDVDLGFTPATNLLPLKRLDIGSGRPTQALAAYLTFPELRLERLEQTYEKLGDGRYRYTSPAYGYDDTLDVSPDGFVTHYPKLWRAVG